MGWGREEGRGRAPQGPKKGEQNKKRGNGREGRVERAESERGPEEGRWEGARRQPPEEGQQEKRKGGVCQQHRRKPRKHAGRVAPSRLLFFLPPSPPLAAHTPLSSLQLVPRAFVTSPILILRELGTPCPECVERNRLERGKGRERVREGWEKRAPSEQWWGQGLVHRAVSD